MDIDQLLCPWFCLLFENHKIIFDDQTSDISCSNLGMDSLNKSDEVMIMYNIYEMSKFKVKLLYSQEFVECKSNVESS